MCVCVLIIVRGREGRGCQSLKAYQCAMYMYKHGNHMYRFSVTQCMYTFTCVDMIEGPSEGCVDGEVVIRTISNTRRIEITN